MSPKTPEKSVSGMGVLKDIRGLLSTTKKGEAPVEVRPEAGEALTSEIERLKAQVDRYIEQIRKQERELAKLEGEKNELAAKLKTLDTGKDKPAASDSRAKVFCSEIGDLEARKNELSMAISQIDDLLQLKVKELSRRIVRFYQEAGQEGVAIDFRRASDGLEVAENFAYFLRELLRE